MEKIHIERKWDGSTSRKGGKEKKEQKGKDMIKGEKRYDGKERAYLLG